MKLTDRMDAARGIPPRRPVPDTGDAPTTALPDAPAATQPVALDVPIAPSASPAVVAQPATPVVKVHDALAELKERAAQELFERIGARMNDSSLTEEKLHAFALAEL
ncbi:MAG: pilus assembly protein CpaF, partial [Microbacteriaceae bacterium]|nr:pilus assembly protein CpaF [Microbacteriaceae bacterium]